MRATLYVVDDPVLLNNGIFFNESFYGMKNSAFMFETLRQQLKRFGIELATQDIHPPEQADLVISVDQTLPFQQAAWRAKHQYLVISEPSTYFPHNWDKAYHTVFDKVFTYDRRLIDNQRYFHYNFAIDLTENQYFYPTDDAEYARRKLCVLVAASFGVSAPPKGSNSLLNERYKTLQWFSQHHPDEFDFYSRGVAANELESVRGARVLRKVLPKALFTALGRWRKRTFDRVYRGPLAADGKIQALRNYRFNIAYENTKDLSGYLTEKLFDSFVACCVPVYWGDPDVEKAIPPNCFIDRRNFASTAALYQHLRHMSADQYRVHTDAITRFVTGGLQEAEFGSAANAWRIAHPILQDLGRHPSSTVASG